MEAKAESDEDFGAALEAAHRSYQGERDLAVVNTEGPQPSGGVGGARVGVKCLHAHYAHTRAGGTNPVGEVVSDWVEPLNCEEACVLDGEMNPNWVSLP
jgi:hypothetical protein